MQPTTAIILAGGLGTRLKKAVPELPKCLAPVNDVPFINYVLEELLTQGITHFIFALGYKSEAVQEYIKEWQITHANITVDFSIETKPLGTGGAILKALGYTHEKQVFVLNGDTLFKVNLQQMALLHSNSNATCTLALKPMQNFDRYGLVLIDENQRIQGFQEKKTTTEGLINGGIYLLNKEEWLQYNWPAAFSFEQDYLQAMCGSSVMMGCIQNGYFIDIGIPADYQKAQDELEISTEMLVLRQYRKQY